MTISLVHLLGMVLTVCLIIGVGAMSGRKVKNAADFSTGGGRAGTWIVAGAIMGTLVSGQATIGTAQLAFSYGLSAWWFTLGSGIGCLILAAGYVIPLRESGQTTLLAVISEEWGPEAGYLGSILCSIGIFISIIAQVLAAEALLMTIFSINGPEAAGIAIAVMAVYVTFGGVWGAGMGGIIKLILLYASAVAGGVAVWGLTNGYGNLAKTLHEVLAGTPLGALSGLSGAASLTGRFENLLARGTMKDIGSGLSLVLGVLSTQTYAQAIWSAKSDSTARKGALISAVMIPPIGIACILIGLFMRSHCITAAELQALNAAGLTAPAGLQVIASSAQVFPTFILDYMPRFFGGVILGTLLITVVGGGAGLSLGAATILTNDIFATLLPRLRDQRTRLAVTRVTILCVLLAGAAVACLVPGAIINDFGFLSMGLRGAVVFIPMSAALFWKGCVKRGNAISAMIAGPIAVLAGNLANLPFDALFLGLAVSLVCCLLGKKKPRSL